MVIDDILEESLEYYQLRRARLIGAILTAPPGSACLRRRGGIAYWYLRTYAGGNARRELYLGPRDDPRVRSLLERMERRRAALGELRQVNQALKKLGLRGKSLARHDLQPVINELFSALNKEGLWRSGMMLVGSWCFMVYQNYCGVEFFPQRTLDIDLALKLPYRGEAKDLGALFESLGFRQEFNLSDGSIFYDNGEIKLELIGPLTGKGEQGKNLQVKKLGVAPIRVRYLNLLLDHTMPLAIRGVGEVMVPSLPAFFLHKLLVAGERKEAPKAEKDILQASAVAKSLAASPELLDELRVIWEGIPAGWRKRILKQAQALDALPPDQSGAALALLKHLE